MPQITAISECVKVADRFGIPVIGDGGIRYSGDIAKAIAAGAHTVMMGSMFAGTEESPGETILYEGRSYKMYRGMGSIDAMQQGVANATSKTPAKGVNWLPKGLWGGCRSRASSATPFTSWWVGCAVWAMLAPRISKNCASSHALSASRSASLTESHPHDITITKEAPNYGQR
jgi:IMP dehydrogenase